MSEDPRVFSPFDGRRRRDDGVRLHRTHSRDAGEDLFLYSSLLVREMMSVTWNRAVVVRLISLVDLGRRPWALKVGAAEDDCPGGVHPGSVGPGKESDPNRAEGVLHLRSFGEPPPRPHCLVTPGVSPESPSSVTSRFHTLEKREKKGRERAEVRRG